MEGVTRGGRVALGLSVTHVDIMPWGAVARGDIMGPDRAQWQFESMQELFAAC